MELTVEPESMRSQEGEMRDGSAAMAGAESTCIRDGSATMAGAESTCIP